jgi:phage gp29-like protein
MRSISTTTGKQIPLDGDLLAILETLFHEITAKVIEGGSYEDMNREINHLVSQMSDEDLRAYLTESLFLNQVKYENDRLEQYIKKLGKSEARREGKDVRE